MTPSFLLGAGGRLILANGKPLPLTPGQAPNTGITLTPFFLNTSQATDARFNIQTTAASNDTTGNVPIIFTYTGGAPASVQSRIVDSGGNAISGFDWTDISATVTTDGAGNGLGYVNAVPAGIGYKRQVRTGAFTSNDTTPFNIGIMTLPWGQSNDHYTLDGGIGRSNPVPGTAYAEDTYFAANGTGSFFGEYGSVGVSNNNSIGSYTTNGGGGLSLLRLVGSALQARFGRKVGVAINPWAQDGQPMAAFMTPSNTSPMLTNGGTNGGGIGFSSPKNYITNGDYRIVSFHQGETGDSDDSPMLRSTRFDKLVRFCQMHINWVAQFGRRADQLTFLFAIMGPCDKKTDGSVWSDHQEILRAAVNDLVAYGKQQTPAWDVRIGWNCIDLDPLAGGDAAGLHMQGADRTRSVRRLTQAMMNVLNPTGVPYGAAGPSIQGTVVKLDSITRIITGNATRSVDTVTLNVTHEGGTTLAAKTPGSPITGWYANTSPDFSGTDLVVSNVTIGSDGKSVVMTVKDSAGNSAPTTFYIKHCGGKFYTQQSYQGDVSNLIYDNFVYPTGANAGDQFTGLPLQPTPDAIKVG